MRYIIVIILSGWCGFLPAQEIQRTKGHTFGITFDNKYDDDIPVKAHAPFRYWFNNKIAHDGTIFMTIYVDKLDAQAMKTAKKRQKNVLKLISKSAHDTVTMWRDDEQSNRIELLYLRDK